MDNLNKRIQSSLLEAAELLSEKYETRSEATILSHGSSIESQLMENAKLKPNRHVPPC